MSNTINSIEEAPLPDEGLAFRLQRFGYIAASRLIELADVELE